MMVEEVQINGGTIIYFDHDLCTNFKKRCGKCVHRFPCYTDLNGRFKYRFQRDESIRIQGDTPHKNKRWADHIGHVH